jgi:hypothetical protein
VLQKWVGLWVALQLFLFCEGLACVLIFWTVGLGWYCRSVRVADNGRCFALGGFIVLGLNASYRLIVA